MLLEDNIGLILDISISLFDTDTDSALTVEVGKEVEKEVVAEGEAGKEVEVEEVSTTLISLRFVYVINHEQIEVTTARKEKK